MTPVSSVNSAALLILTQTNSVIAGAPARSGTDDLLAVANGVTGKIGASRQPTQAQSKISQSMFDLNTVSITRMKLDLIDRTGKALGVDQADYASRDDFVDAMQKAFVKLKTEGGQLAVIGLEKDLGLDKLGVSVEDVIDSAKDPEANDRLTKALEKKTGKTSEKGEGDDRQTAALSAAQPNALGLYGIPNL